MSAWEIADSPIRISSSKRISAQIAKVIRNLCILPEESLEGENRGDRQTCTGSHTV